MTKINIDNVDKDIIFKVIAGSKAYGLDIPTSDTDIRGVFLQPNDDLLGFNYTEQVSDIKNDVVYYELNRFVRLLAGNNPNILENLFSPKDKILYMSEVFKPIYDNRYKFLTKKIRITFGGYAVSQIKKARGLNKKIVNPVAKEKKTPLDFCYIFEKEDGYMMTANQWLKKHGKKQESVGLAEMPNGVQLYKVHYDWLSESKNDNPRFSEIQTHGFKGIVSENGDDIRHSEIPKQFPVEAFLFYNKDGYSSYCKDYREYWDWVDKRNPSRYNNNSSQGYDGKNMMHCLRMLDMAIEIAEGKGMNLVRSNRKWLLSVRRGEVPYSDIINLIEEKNKKMDETFEVSSLPEKVEEDFIRELVLTIRNKSQISLSESQITNDLDEVI